MSDWRQRPWALKRAAERAARRPLILQRRAELKAKREQREALRARGYIMPAAIRASTWRKLNAGLMVKHLPLFGPLPAAQSEHIRPDLTEWAGTTLIQSDERYYA